MFCFRTDPDNFEIIGTLNIIDYLDKNGNVSMNISGWELIKDFFANRINSVMLERRQKTFKIGAIIKDCGRTTGRATAKEIYIAHPYIAKALVPIITLAAIGSLELIVVAITACDFSIGHD
ncbi:hypothetical protein IQ31_04978 [Sphingobacterium siyangense]|uniref:Uncharacterized protein n=2 Tax=Sphingobacterium siyangense TaxID=459529 RepID=A0A562M6L3_9SPHI|nr:hypothetical protein IQ31_04978 [Sphingobacterium siyangense]